MPIASIDPADETVRAEFTPHDDAFVEAAIARSAELGAEMRAMGGATRASLLRSAADVLERRADDLALLMTEEMGKTLTAARAEAIKCASACRYYAEHAAAFLADEPVGDAGLVAHLPLGPILAVMPWNFPFWQVVRFAAPALAAGNTCLLKHASNVPRCALALEEVFEEAGFPEGAFKTLLIPASRVEGVLRDRRVRGATLTGSEPAGSAVGRVAGEEIKPSVLELGGTDPFLVMPSADMKAAVAAAVLGRTQNNGQSCIAAKRFIVHSDVYAAFRDRFAAALGALVVGDPKAADTDVGPLALGSIREEVDGLVGEAMSKGARRVCGARIVEGPNGGKGYWYEPGLIEAVPEDATAYAEELFGPVALLFEVQSLDAGIELANATAYGLGSVVFTREEAEAEAVIRRVEAGATAINRIVASDPRLPFGGVKRSGYGRELARDGVMAFVNRKTVTRA